MRRKRRIIYYILLIIFAGVFVYSLIQINKIQSDYRKGVNEYTSLFDQAVIMSPSGSDATDETNSPLGYRIEHEKMKELNSDYVGWISIPNTAINYPMVKSPNNDYYLHLTFLKEYNFAGTIFLDFRTPELDGDNTIIYGHRMNNGSMFADLEKFLSKSFYEENRYVYIFIDSEVLIYEIFSVRIVEIEDDCYTIYFPDTNAHASWLKQMKNYSRYTTDYTPEAGENVITLSTCVRGNETVRNVVQAQLVERFPLT